MNSKDEYRSFVCIHCKKTFKRKYHLNRHLSSVHEDKKEFECQFCSFRTSRKDYLKRHVNEVHYNLRLCVCKFCGQRFNQSGIEFYCSFWW